MSERVCEFEGCEAQARKLRLCGGHYQQQWRGEPLTPILRTFEQRFWAKVEKTDHCWNWLGGKNSKGYGHIWLKGSTVSAHRVSLMLEGVDLADEVEIDHLCKNRSCVRPNHLRLVCRAENVRNTSWDPTKSESGFRGVYRNGSSWRGKVGMNGETHYLGTYKTPEEAREKVQEFVKENGIIWDTRELLSSDQAALPAS